MLQKIRTHSRFAVSRGIPRLGVFLLCLGGALVLAGCATTPPPAPEACVQQVQARADAFRTATGCPGVTVGFVLADGRAGAVASGISDKTTGRTMQPDDRMLLGSVGKTYVSAVLLQLVEEGRVELDTKISHWFGAEPWFHRLPNAEDLTLRHLATHTSGILRYIYTDEFKQAFKANLQRTWEPEELIAFALDSEPLFPVDEGWSYADTNYILVGMIIERVMGRTYYEELNERILEPWKLRATTPSDHPELPGTGLRLHHGREPARSACASRARWPLCDQPAVRMVWRRADYHVARPGALGEAALRRRRAEAGDQDQAMRRCHNNLGPEAGIWLRRNAAPQRARASPGPRRLHARLSHHHGLLPRPRSGPWRRKSTPKRV